MIIYASQKKEDIVADRRQARIIVLVAIPSAMADGFSIEESKRLQGIGKQLERFEINKSGVVYALQNPSSQHAAGEIACGLNRVYWRNDIINLIRLPLTCESLLTLASNFNNGVQVVVYLGGDPVFLRGFSRNFCGNERYSFLPGDCLFINFEKSGKNYTFKGKVYFKAASFDLL